MYAYIKGKISEINPTNIVVDNNGIGYEIVVANPYEYQLEEEKTNIHKANKYVKIQILLWIFYEGTKEGILIIIKS